MTSLEKYRDEVKNQIAKGVNFNESVWTVDAFYFADIAKRYGYHRSKSSYFGPGRAFYECLQRVYNQMKKRGEV